MAWKNKLNNWRWKKTKTGYVLDKLIFNITLFSIILYILFIAASMGFDFSQKIYVSCPQETPCANPFNPPEGTPHLADRFQKKCTHDWCDWEQLPPGFEFGEKPSKVFSTAWIIVFVLLALAFTANHLLYNKGKPFLGLEVNS